MTLAIDVYESISEALSAVIEKVLNDEKISQPATLASVRKEILKNIKTPTIPLNSFSDDQLQELSKEIDALIEQYDKNDLAVRFFKPRASQALTCVIHAGMERLGEPTLSRLFAEVESGLVAQLIAGGELDDDETQTVVAELQALIDKHGPDAIAEEFVRYL